MFYGGIDSKKGGVKDSKNFRSINLAGGLYKWLAKGYFKECWLTRSLRFN